MTEIHTRPWSRRVLLDWSRIAQANPHITTWRLVQSTRNAPTATQELVITQEVSHTATGLEPNSTYVFSLEGSQKQHRNIIQAALQAGQPPESWHKLATCKVQTKPKPRPLDPIPMDRDGAQRFREKILNYKLSEEFRCLFPEDTEVLNVNLLVIGRFGGGKSRLVNTLFSSLSSKIESPATAKKLSGHVTSVFTLYELDEATELKGRMKCKLNIYDTWGFDDHNYASGEFGLMLDGKMPSNWNMAHKGELVAGDDPRFIQNPSIKDQMHCVLFVVNPEDVDTATGRWDFFQREIEKRNIQALIILPKIDSIDDTLDENPENYLRSDSLLEAIAQVQEKTGVEINEIFPIKNYERERFKKDSIDSLALNILDAAVQKAEDFFAKTLNKKRDQAWAPASPGKPGDEKIRPLAIQVADLFEKRLFAEARAACQKILEMDPRSQFAWSFSTRAALESGSLGDAEAAATRLASIHPTLKNKLLLAKVLIMNKEFHQTEEILERHHCNEAEYFELRGLCLEQKGDVDEALDSFEQAVSAGYAPDSRDRLKTFKTRLMGFEANLGPSTARKNYDELLELRKKYPENPDIFYYLVKAAQYLLKADDYKVLPVIGEIFTREKGNFYLVQRAKGEFSSFLQMCETQYISQNQPTRPPEFQRWRQNSAFDSPPSTPPAYWLPSDPVSPSSPDRNFAELKRRVRSGGLQFDENVLLTMLNDNNGDVEQTLFVLGL